MTPSGHVHGRRPTDSAGVPWAGRTLTEQPFAGDDGSAAPAVVAALAALAPATTAPERLHAEAAVVAALAGTRLLVPVVAVLGEGEEVVASEGDKSADMALVTLTGADGRRALPAFTSVAACASWDASARPVPVEAERAALATVGEGCDVLVLDPAGPVTHVVRRPAVWALGQGLPWVPAPFDPVVAEAVAGALTGLDALAGVRCEPGRRAETAVVLGVRPGLDAAALQTLLADVSARLAADTTVAERVDSLELRPLTAG